MTVAEQELPFYLQQFVTTQDYDQYTAIDQAAWRFVMRLSRDFFKVHGHPDYLSGLEKTGISIDAIPRISDMDEKLKKLGWRAVAITGFIPPEAFLEMIAHSFLPIACDMRKLENLDYTPSPDIIHEAAGHAPMVANSEYSSFLHRFGKLARKVIFAKEDWEVYRAILRLSETKEDPSATQEDLMAAQTYLDHCLAQVSYVSEAVLLNRLAWWTTEYGLFYDRRKHQFLIFGAGLLSSVGESYHCLSEGVRKIPLDIDCVNQTFDITKPQPQLYYVEDLKQMTKLVDMLEKQMAFSLGGAQGLEIAKKAQTVTTSELDSGLQIGGIVQDFLKNDQGEVIFIKYQGPTQLAYGEKQILGQGPTYHREGYSTPIGKIHRGLDMEKITPLGGQKIEGQKIHLEFESGFELKGVVKSLSFSEKGSPLLLSLTEALLTYQEKVYFDPAWGDFDLALGIKVVSVFGGAPDRGEYLRETGGKFFTPRKQNNNRTQKNLNLTELYQKVRDLREGKSKEKGGLLTNLEQIKELLDQQYSEDWLLRMELLELSRREGFHGLEADLMAQLKHCEKKSDKIRSLIERGLRVLD